MEGGGGFGSFSRGFPQLPIKRKKTPYCIFKRFTFFSIEIETRMSMLLNLIEMALLNERSL